MTVQFSGIHVIEYYKDTNRQFYDLGKALDPLHKGKPYYLVAGTKGGMAMKGGRYYGFRATDNPDSDVAMSQLIQAEKAKELNIKYHFLDEFLPIDEIKKLADELYHPVKAHYYHPILYAMYTAAEKNINEWREVGKNLREDKGFVLPQKEEPTRRAVRHFIASLIERAYILNDSGR